MLVGMVLAAFTVFIIDRRFVWAAGFALFGAGLTLVGLVHSPKVHVFSGEKIALGYAMAALVCVAFAYYKPPLRVLDPTDPEDIEGAAFEPDPEPVIVPPPPGDARRRVPEPVPG